MNEKSLNKIIGELEKQQMILSDDIKKNKIDQYIKFDF